MFICDEVGHFNPLTLTQPVGFDLLLDTALSGQIEQLHVYSKLAKKFDEKLVLNVLDMLTCLPDSAII